VGPLADKVMHDNYSCYVDLVEDWTSKNLLYLGHQPLTDFVQGGVENCEFFLNISFYGRSYSETVQGVGISCKGLI